MTLLPRHAELDSASQDETLKRREKDETLKQVQGDVEVMVVFRVTLPLRHAELDSASQTRDPET